MNKLSPAELREMQSNAGQAVEVLRALSNEARLLVLCRLIQGEMSVSELNEAADLSQSALSQHLARLRADELVTTRRDGQTIFYRIADPRVGELVAAMHEIFCKPHKGRRS